MAGLPKILENIPPRWLRGGGVAIAVVLTLIIVTRGERYQNVVQFKTQYELRSLGYSVEHMREKDGTLPNQLPRAATDFWGNPIFFSTDGNRFLVTSYGADGAPGGSGFDHHLTHLDAQVPEAARVSSIRRPEFWVVCAITAAFAFRIGFSILPCSRRGEVTSTAIAARLLATLIGTSLVGWFLLILCYSPSNH
jgi:hypothetical protein